MTRLLVAVDGGPPAWRAVDLAAQIAPELRAGVTLIRVLAPDDDEAAARVDLDAMAELFPAGSKRVDKVIRRGGTETVADQILSLAGTLPADLVVIGTRSRPALVGRVFGSVSDRVVRAARCPVAVVSGGSRAMAAPHRILLAIEGDAGFGPLITATERLATALDARVTVAHVYYGDADKLERAAYHTLETHAERAVGQAVASLREAGVHAEPAMLANRAGVASELAACAERVGADLLVTGRHPEPRREEALVGTIAHAIVRRSRRPVVVVAEGSYLAPVTPPSTTSPDAITNLESSEAR